MRRDAMILSSLVVALLIISPTWAQETTPEATPQIMPEATPELANVDEYIIRAELSFGHQEFRFAVADFTSALALDASRTDASVGRAKANIELNRYDDVFNDLNAVIAVMPENALAHTLRGFAYRMINDTANGNADIAKAKELDPTSPEPYNYMGLYYNFAGQYNEAIIQLNQSLIISPNQSMTLNSRAVSYAYLGRTQEALADLTQAVTLNPQSAFLFTNRATLYRNLQNLPNALTDINRALNLQPTYALAYLQRALIYVDFGATTTDNSQRNTFYQSALNDIDLYVLYIHPDDLNPQVLLFRQEIQNAINTNP
jgi:tetratricopeptide (TPR) repeat protein